MALIDATKRATCPVCGKSIALRGNVLRAHGWGWELETASRCPGSNQKPQPKEEKQR